MKNLNSLILSCIMCFGFGIASAQYTATISGTISNMSAGDTATIYVDSLGGVFTFYNAKGTATGTQGSYTVAIQLYGAQSLWVWTVDCKGDTLVDSLYMTSQRPQAIVNFNYCTNTPPPAKYSTVSGLVTRGGNIVTDGTVLLIEKDQGVLTAVDTFLLTSSTRGYYNFTLPDSTKSYLVKAFLNLGNNHYFNYFPTYSDSALNWSGANSMAPAYNTTYTRNIMLKAGMNMGGPGFIGGLIIAGANKSEAEGDPIVGAQIMLLQNNQPIIYTRSNAKGEFKFDNLAYGTYTVYTEIAGLTTLSKDVTISEDRKKEEGVKVTVTSAGITTDVEIVKNIGENNLTAWNYYPNPVTDKLHFEFGNELSNAAITVIDLTGKTVNELSFESISEAIIPMEELKQGTYFVTVQTESDLKTFKIVRH